MRITYSSNNSGGSFWLSQKDWSALEEKGWVIDPHRYGDQPMYASLIVDTEDEDEALEDAMASFTVATGQDVDAKGCSCCGCPHNFYEDDDD